MVGPSETGKSQILYNWLKSETFQKKFDKVYYFYQHSQPLFFVMQKEIENLEFVQGVNFDFKAWLMNNGTKYLIIFHNSCERFAIQKRFSILLLLEDIVD